MRSKWKIPFVNFKLLYLFNKKKELNNSFFTMSNFVYSRNSIILSDFINYRFNVHNGKTFRLIKVSKDMIGFKFGQFSYTKRLGFLIHKKKIIKNKKGQKSINKKVAVLKKTSTIKVKNKK